MLRSTLPLAALLLVSTARGDGRIVEVSYPGSEEPGELMYAVTYRAWIPDGVKTLRGVIVHQHGCGAGACKGGETAADDLQWQALARKWDCALLGPSYKQEDKQDCRKWCDPRNGSRDRFLQALRDLAAKSDHPELDDVPWCLWGHSGGGFWASLMMTSDPDRIVAAWLRSGTAFAEWEKGGIAKPEIRETTYGIPFIANPGVKERDDVRFKGAWDGGLAMTKAFRSRGAPAAFAPDPRTGHECGESRDLAIPYFDACLAARLPEKGSNRLRPIDPASGWLAPFEGGEAIPARGAEPGIASGAGWLPTAEVARAWDQYTRDGTIPDSTPPPPPFGVKAARGDGEKGVRIAWDVHSDLESGLKQFVILRDGEPIGIYPEKPIGRFGRPLFQSVSYHDTPEAPLPPMSYVDRDAPAGKMPEYRIVAVNGVGLESRPSEPSRR